MFFMTRKQMENAIKIEVAALREDCLAEMARHRDAVTAAVNDAITTRTEEEKQKRYASDEPYIQLISERLDEEGNVELNLDWNKAFIRLLKVKGFKARTEDEYIELWLSSLGKQADDNIGEKSFS